MSMRLVTAALLVPCLLADSLRGNVTAAPKLLATAAGCSAADAAQMSQLGSGNADGTFPKYLSQCGKHLEPLFRTSFW